MNEYRRPRKISPLERARRQEAVFELYNNLKLGESINLNTTPEWEIFTKTKTRARRKIKKSRKPKVFKHGIIKMKNAVCNPIDINVDYIKTIEVK